jgi:hypothetical protein
MLDWKILVGTPITILLGIYAGFVISFKHWNIKKGINQWLDKILIDIFQT